LLYHQKVLICLAPKQVCVPLEGIIAAEESEDQRQKLHSRDVEAVWKVSGRGCDEDGRFSKIPGAWKTLLCFFPPFQL
jgi:hypothetical protein